MILTYCAVCATDLGLTRGKKCGRCSTRYCGAACQAQHWKERGHDQLCKKIKRAGGAEQYYANNKYSEAVAVAAEACAEEDGVVGDTVRALKGLGDRFAPAVGYECVDAPSKCMVARYEQGGYRTHLDHDPPSDDDLYWLWKSSREQSGRVLTAILYLTDPDFDACLHGGCLRLFLGCADGDASGETATSIRDVAPVPGRLVVFKARCVPHAVLDTSRRRLALSCWHLAPEA